LKPVRRTTSAQRSKSAADVLGQLRGATCFMVEAHIGQALAHVLARHSLSHRLGQRVQQGLGRAGAGP
jgi:hypothetical protein